MPDTISTIKSKRMKAEIAHANWEIDERLPFKCTNAKAGGVQRFSTLDEALRHAELETGRMLVTGWVKGRYKIFLYRFN